MRISDWSSDLCSSDLLAEHFKDAKIAIIDDKTPYGQGLAEATKKAMNAAGVTEVIREGVNAGNKDFSALIAQMKEAGVTILYWGGLHPEAGLLLKKEESQGGNECVSTCRSRWM